MVPTETPKSSSPFVMILLGVLAVALTMGSPFLRFSDIWKTPVIVVGNTEIYEEEFKWLFLKKLRQLQNLPTLNQDDLPQYILHVVQEICKDAAVREEMRQLGIRVSDRYVKQLITKYPEFQDKKGKFSERKFREHLQENSLGFKRFFALEKERIGKRRLQHAVLSGFHVPKALKDSVEHAIAQKRTICWKKYEILEDSLSTLEKPSTSTLRTMYGKQNLMSPDRKRVIMVKLSRQEDMVKVEEEISSGKNLQEIAQTLKLPVGRYLVHDEKDLAQSFIGQSDPALRTSVHAKLQKMEPGGTPELFQDQKFTYLVQVHENVPSRKLSFEEAKPQLEKSWGKEAYLRQLIEKANREKKNLLPKQMARGEITWLGHGTDVPDVVKRTALSLSPQEWRVVTTSSAIWLCYLEDIEELYVKAQESREMMMLLQEEWKQQAWHSYVLGLLNQYPKTVNMKEIEKILANWKRGS